MAGKKNKGGDSGGRTSTTSTQGGRDKGGDSGGRTSTTSTQGGRDSSDKKVEKATSTIKSAISQITTQSPNLGSNLDAYKKALNVLKSSGKEERAEKLQERAREAKKEAQKQASITQSNNDNNQRYASIISTLTKELDTANERAAQLNTQSQSAYSKDDVLSLLNETKNELTSGFEDWKEQYQQISTAPKPADITDSSTTSVSTSPEKDSFVSSSTTSELEPFDPNLFRSLLGELESSRYRQKERNEQLAKASYKY